MPTTTLAQQQLGSTNDDVDVDFDERFCATSHAVTYESYDSNGVVYDVINHGE